MSKGRQRKQNRQRYGFNSWDAEGVYVFPTKKGRQRRRRALADNRIDYALFEPAEGGYGIVWGTQAVIDFQAAEAEVAEQVMDRFHENQARKFLDLLETLKGTKPDEVRVYAPKGLGTADDLYAFVANYTGWAKRRMTVRRQDIAQARVDYSNGLAEVFLTPDVYVVPVGA